MSAPLPSPARPADLDDARPGLIAGRFETVRLLGDGSFALVYEAIDRDLGRRVALKLFTSFAEDELEAALREARAMARLNHEHVLAVHDIGEHRGTPFLAIEFAEMDLRRWLAAGNRDAASVMDLFCQAGRGLEAAHRAGLVHHDFKPANVLLRANGTVAVGDFGLARHLDTDDEREPTPNEHSYALGTLRYIAPERLRGLPGDERSDQFSFCVALWEALAGVHPFFGANAQERLQAIAAGPRGTPKHTPARVIRALRRGLAADPYDRFESMTDLLAAFADDARRAPSRWLRHAARPLLTGAMLVGVFTLGVGLSREAPALDVSVTPSAVLTADAALDKARDAVFDGRYDETSRLVAKAMPIIRSTSEQHRRAYVAELEVLGDLLDEAGAHRRAAIIYSAGKSLAEDIGLATDGLVAKRSTALAKHTRDAELTTGRGM